MTTHELIQSRRDLLQRLNELTASYPSDSLDTRSLAELVRQRAALLALWPSGEVAESNTEAASELRDLFDALKRKDDALMRRMRQEQSSVRQRLGCKSRTSSQGAGTLISRQA